MLKSIQIYRLFSGATGSTADCRLTLLFSDIIRRESQSNALAAFRHVYQVRLGALATSARCEICFRSAKVDNTSIAAYVDVTHA